MSIANSTTHLPQSGEHWVWQMPHDAGHSREVLVHTANAEFCIVRFPSGNIDKVYTKHLVARLKSAKPRALTAHETEVVAKYTGTPTTGKPLSLLRRLIRLLQPKQQKPNENQ